MKHLRGSEYFPYTLYIYIINIHSTHTYIMQTKLCKHDYSFDSPNIYISVYVYQGRRFAFDIGGVTIIIVIIYIAYFFIVCLTDSNYTIIIL